MTWEALTLRSPFGSAVILDGSLHSYLAHHRHALCTVFVQVVVERRLDEPCGGQNGNV